ncbi:MAG: hypothetical protein JWM02_3398 [Frankiales bacterium]|nr:hypothetical protein [Frankiales bacterium]
MSRYLFEVSYTGESWANQVHAHANVVDRISPLAQKLGGRIDSVYYTFGDRDLVALIDFQSAEDAAAFSLAATAGGAVKSIKTTPLLTVDQGIAAMAKADSAASVYHAPTGTTAQVR